MKRPGHWSAARAWQTNVVLLLIGAGMMVLAQQFLREYEHFTIGMSGVSGWSVVLYVVAAWLILTQPVNRWTFSIILAVAVIDRLIPYFADPFLSTDIYRYVWDGIVQHAGISPYRYVPADPALAFLSGPNMDVFESINRREYAHTIYPPAAQMLFYLVTRISPTVAAMKMAMVLFEGVTLYTVVVLLRELGVRREQALLYAWCPLLVWEFAGSGHLDSAAMAFIGLALMARYRKQAVLTGVFLAVAVLIKLYPIVLLPALFRRGEYRMPAALLAVIAFGYACYARVGMRVFGFLSGYVKEEGMDSGTRYFLLELVQHVPGLQGVPSAIFLGFCGMVFAGLLLWAWSTCCAPEQEGRTRAERAQFLWVAYGLGLALMLLFSPHYPWYIAWLVPFVAMLPTLPGFTYVCAMFYLCTTALAVGTGPLQFRLNEYLYGCGLMALLVELGMRRWPPARRLVAGVWASRMAEAGI